MVTTDNPLEDGSPRLAESSAAVPEDVTSLVTSTGTPATSEGSTPPVQLDTPVVVGNTPRVPAHAAPSVAAGDLFVGAEKGTPSTSGRPRSKPVSVERAIRTVIAYILVLAILGAAGIAAFALVQGTWMVTPVLSGSMRPGLAVGGAAISQRVPVDSLHVRDVIIFSDPYKPSEQIVHRIVRIAKSKSGQRQFNTQGDANPVRDPWTITIRGDDVYKVRWTVPLLGYVANSYQNHRGYYLLGAGVVLILIAVVTILETRTSRRRRHSRRAVPAPALTGQARDR
jgi:signal peptidase